MTDQTTDQQGLSAEEIEGIRDDAAWASEHGDVKGMADACNRGIPDLVAHIDYLSRYEAALREQLSRLEAMEWRPERNMKGTMTNFCPICGGTPSLYAMNKHTARPDGHWRLGVRLVNGECPLALLLDHARAALSTTTSAAPADTGESDV